MFRRPALRLKQLASPFLKRGAAARAEQTLDPRALPKPFWSSSRVLLFTSVTAATTYFAGVSDDFSRFPVPWQASNKPRYATKTGMKKARSEPCTVFSTDRFPRPLVN